MNYLWLTERIAAILWWFRDIS